MLKIPVNYPRDALVDVNGIAMAKQGFASLLNPNVRFLPAINHKMINFMDGFIENAGGLKDGFVVHPDQQGAAELVEIEFDEVPFRCTYFQGKFDTSSVSLRTG